MGPGSGVRVLALRTCKADVVVGLTDGEDERIKELTGEDAKSPKIRLILLTRHNAT
jgi:hypothetical protein